jgi:hypothetical protein
VSRNRPEYESGAEASGSWAIPNVKWLSDPRQEESSVQKRAVRVVRFFCLDMHCPLAHPANNDGWGHAEQMPVAAASE